MNMRRVSSPIGSIVRIPLPDDSFGYARVIVSPYFAFYDYRTTTPSNELDVIVVRPVLFRAVVSEKGLGDWKVIGVMPLMGEVTEPVVAFRQDVRDFRECLIFDTNGHERAASPEECIGIERQAVWEVHHIEERLLDAFEGRPNSTEVFLRVRLG